MRTELKELFEQGALWKGEKVSSAHSVVLHDALPELSFGATHEWSLSEQLGGTHSFHPPLMILSTALRNALKKNDRPQTVLWIGERCWPTVTLLEQMSEGLEWSWRKNSILINSSSKEQRVYALRKALASPAVLAVVGDASGLSATATRQLQLAARTGATLGLLVRPEAELEKTSCAQTKWHVSPYSEEAQSVQPSKLQTRSMRSAGKLLAYTGTPQWNVTLLRAPGLAAPKSWKLEWDEERFELREFFPASQVEKEVEADQQAPQAVPAYGG